MDKTRYQAKPTTGMNKLDVITSQSRARDELVQDDVWNDMDEDIWAEIFRDKNGETVLRNISSDDNSTHSESNLENIIFEETCFEVLWNFGNFLSRISQRLTTSRDSLYTA